MHKIAEVELGPEVMPVVFLPLRLCLCSDGTKGEHCCDCLRSRDNAHASQKHEIVLEADKHTISDLSCLIADRSQDP